MVPDDAEALQPDLFFQPDPRLPFGDGDLVFHRIHTFKIRKQKPPPPASADDDPVILHVQLRRGRNLLGLTQHVDADLQEGQFAFPDGIKARVAGRGADGVLDDLFRQIRFRRRDGTDAATQLPVLMNGNEGPGPRR